MLSYRSKPHCGGQGVYIRHLSRELVRLGHEVEVFSGQPYPDLVAEPDELAAQVADVDALTAAVRLAPVGQQGDAHGDIMPTGR